MAPCPRCGGAEVPVNGCHGHPAAGPRRENRPRAGHYGGMHVSDLPPNLNMSREGPVAAPARKRSAPPLSADQSRARIDRTAIVESGAEIGAGTALWHHVHIRRGAHIGQGCNIADNAFVDEGVHIGDRVKLQNNVSVYRGVTLEDEVFVGPSAVFTNDLQPRSVSPDWVVTPTLVRRGASIGANATIVCGCEIGEWAMIGAGAVVTHDVQPNQLVYGSPARPRGWVCRCGAVVSRDAERPIRMACTACGDTFA